MLAHNDLSADVAATSLPTLIIAGELDPTANVAQSRWLQEQIGERTGGAGGSRPSVEPRPRPGNSPRPSAGSSSAIDKSLATFFVDSMPSYGQPVAARHKRTRRRLRMAGWGRDRPLRRAGLFRDRGVPFLRRTRRVGAHLWREGLNLQQIKEARHREAEKAAAVLGATLHAFDADDYPLIETPELVEKVARLYRTVMPSIVLTHTERDPWNRDHEVARSIAVKARIIAQAAGFDPGQE